MLDCASRMCLNVASRLSFLCVTPIFTGIQMDVLDANTGRLVLPEFTDPHLHEQELGRDEHSELMLPRHQVTTKNVGFHSRLQSGWNHTGHKLFHWCQATAQGCAVHEALPLLHSSPLRAPGSTGAPGSALPSPLQTLSAPGSSWALDSWSTSAFLALHSKGSLLLILPSLILQLSLAQQCQPRELSPPLSTKFWGFFP